MRYILQNLIKFNFMHEKGIDLNFKVIGFVLFFNSNQLKFMACINFGGHFLYNLIFCFFCFFLNSVENAILLARAQVEQFFSHQIKSKIFPFPAIPIPWYVKILTVAWFCLAATHIVSIGHTKVLCTFLFMAFWH